MSRRARRSFPAEFKTRVVLDLITGRRTQAELCREHQLSPSLPAPWETTFREHLPLVFGGEERLSQDQARIARLEQLVGCQAFCRSTATTRRRCGRSAGSWRRCTTASASTRRWAT
jgi:transposase-like protein